MRATWSAAILACSLLAASPLIAHDVDVTSVARVFLDEIGEGRYLLSIVDTKVPPILDRRGVLPARCAPVAVEDVEIRVVSGFVFECESPLASGDVLILPWSLAGVVVTFGVSSLVNLRMNGEEPSPGAGLDALRDTNYANALAHSLTYWWKEWRTQIKSYFSG